MRVLLIAVFSVATLSAQSNPQSPARLVARSGTVEVQRGNEWPPLNPGDVINPGGRVRTGVRSSAAVELGPASGRPCS